MNRNMLLGLGAVALLVAGWLFWSRPTTDHPPAPDGGIKVVRGSQDDEEQRPETPVAGSGPPAAIADTTTAAADAGARIPDDEELRKSLPDPALSLPALYKRIRSEPRDKEWATRSENGIKAALIPVPYLTRDTMRVSCAATLCEVRGAMDNASMANTNVAMQALQGAVLQKALAANGLEVITSSFGGKGKTSTFTMYARRR